ncbi:CC-NBS-LRR resistance protein [Trifolium medium]|uniref:CC-NBS-LRR resistance protein n=1 Tax=Trifolium medium TaxID=97028 RepID=A0A392LZX9_9FABA|nr:CC-NBS-LRR resistance protein [Trifolium medium]
MPVLKLSYLNLSPQLRQCFAYCALYPKDWIIEKDELIQLWIAQGYLECSDEKQLMEDNGNQFVKIFLMKCFFQDAKIDHCGDIYSFKMHDLIHDLAMKVAGDNCCYLNSETKRLVGSPIHVMLKSDALGLLGSLDPKHHLSESFFPSLEKLKFIGCRDLRGWRRMRDDVNDGDNSSHSYHPSFPRLSEVEALEATLNLVGSIEFSPLSMLKYLKIGGYGLNVDKLPKDLKALPVWVCKLSSLQNITILECKVLASLPEGMPHLTKLQTLEIIDSPLLVKECETQASATWPKLAHVPNII